MARRKTATPSKKRTRKKKSAKRKTERAARSLLPRAQRPPKEVTRDLFLVFRAPRHGRANPHELTNPVWAWLARGLADEDAENRPNAYQINAHFGGPSSFGVGPCWCVRRFGQSRTALRDGRLIAIAGEHEDYYDPDFFIYNDVIVLDPSGQARIFGYPTEVFAPTDFHSATLVEDRIAIIGALGYAGARVPDATPVYMLDTANYAIERRAVAGPPPGWIWNHRAELEGSRIVVRGGKREALREGRAIVIENVDDWSLDLERWSWDRLTERGWQEWSLARADQQGNGLFDISSIRFWQQFDRRELAKIVRERAGMPDFELYDALYAPPVPHTVLEGSDGYPRVIRISVDGATVRYVEDSSHVRVVIEGSLGDDAIRAIVEDARSKLERLEGTPYERHRLQ